METLKAKLIKPVIRFKSFDDSWKETFLSELLSFKNGINASKEDYGSGYKFINVLDIIENDFILNSSIQGSVNISKDIYEKNLVEYGDILFQRSSETRKEVGQSNVYLDKENNATFGGFVIRGKKIANYDPFFLHLALKTSTARKEITSKSGGSTRYNVGQSTLAKVKLYLPEVKEQQKIASFLSVVDRRINQLEQKKEKLSAYKKGAVQQIFSREIRFKDENGKKFPEWKKNKLKKVIQRFIVPMRDKPKDLTGSIPWCRIEDFNGMYLNASKSGQGVSEKVVDNMNLKVFPKGTLLVSCSAYLGRCAIVQKELITNQTFIGLYPKSDVINVEFLYYSMIKSERKLNRLSSGTTISYLSREEFENFQLELPCIEEQRKIASFLTSIDKKIDMVNKQIERTNQFKKGLLQKMFI